MNEPNLFQPMSIVGSKTFCSVVALCALIIGSIWPSTAVGGSLIALFAFYLLIIHRKLPSLTNLAFFFICVTFAIVVSYTALWSALRDLAGLATANQEDLRTNGVQYIAMAIDALVLGACLGTRGRHKTSPRPRQELQNASLYITAAFVPLLLNLILYYTSLRGQDYVEIHNAGLGPEKYILFLVILTHAAFIRLFAGWDGLGQRAKSTTFIAVCLFVYIYTFLLPLRSNLFELGMYALYFFGERIRWYTKMGFVALVLIAFSWIAMYRADDTEKLHDMSLAAGTLSAMSFGTLMVEMVPWAQDIDRTDGCAWGQTFLLELAHSDGAPNLRYVRDRAPGYAEEGRGLGFFYVAELIMNFGYWGGLAAVSILGLGLQRLSLSSRPFIRSTALPAFLAASFQLIRNDMMTDLKIPVYMMIACLLLDETGRFYRYTARLMVLSGALQEVR